MSLTLQRLDYINLGQINQKCMELLPAKDGQTQKVVVADQSGHLTVFGVKKGTPSILFKAPLQKTANVLTLGGQLGSPLDKIFSVVQSEVKAFNRKGKNFLSFSSGMSGQVNSCAIKGSSMFLASDHVYNRFVDLKETDYYLLTDKINSLCVLNTSDSDMRAVLACQDRLLRVLEGSQLQYEVEVPGNPTYVILLNRIGGYSGEEVVYGTSDGQLGVITLGRASPDHGWSHLNELGRGGVTCIDFYKIYGPDEPECMLVGRDDGYVEVFTLSDFEDPKLVFSFCANESVTAVRGGQVNSSGVDEIVVTTYKGWVFGLTPEMQDVIIHSSDAPLPIVVNDTQTQKVAELESEIKDMQTNLAKEKEKFQQLSANAKSGQAYSAAAPFSVNEKFVLSREDASYIMALETQVSLDVILMQSDVPIDIIDSDKSSAVMSTSECDPSEGNFMLVTFRCQANTTRFEVKLRTIEGQYGTLKVYVTPKTQPKFCQVLEYVIKPLSLHQRSHYIDEDKKYNTLTIEGQFSMSDMHSWVRFCLPEVSERPPATEPATLNFVSVFLDTDLSFTYEKNKAVFKSDNISTIAILKDVISREAIKRKVALNANVVMNDATITHVLNLIHPKMEYQIMLAKKVQLIDGLKDLQMQEDDLNFLAPEYQEIIEQEQKIRSEYTRQPAHLERLYGMVTDLFIDKFKFKGINVRNKVDELTAVLDAYDLQSLITFFNKF
ncbi:BBSome complex member BBS7-like [Convolutriloba macropyga]|uniref:BBSome complex member BBS7-like n=1 Tax=Convolutriloba macropyga TaxID=536237 RepID=UPI003F52318A